MNLSTVKSIAVPEGNVMALSIGGVKVWAVPQTAASPWDEVAAAIADGTYKTKYKIGDMVPLDLGSEGLINMQIAAFDADILADGSGTAAISWVAKELLANYHRMNPAYSSGTEGTGTIGGWEKCEMREYLKSALGLAIPETVADIIEPVRKEQVAYDTSDNSYNQITEDSLWIPGYTESNKGGIYYSLFSKTKYVKNRYGVTTKSAWWFRDAKTQKAFRCISAATGNFSDAYATATNYGVCLGFCTGRTPT